MEKKTNPGKPERRWALEPHSTRNTTGTPSAETPLNFIDRRNRRERRIVYDRRQLIRFEDDRRICDERRLGADPWAFP